MFYPIGFLPAELPQTPDAHTPGPPLPAVGQADTKQARLSQRAYPRAQRPDAQLISPNPQLSGRFKLAQATPVMAGSQPLTGAETSTVVAKFGDRNQFVETVQNALKTLEYYQGPVDGVFGPLTEAAVRSFQQSQALSVDGVVGPATRQRLQEQMGPGGLRLKPFSSAPEELTQPEAQPGQTVRTSNGTGSPEMMGSPQPVFSPGLLTIPTFSSLEVISTPRPAQVLWVTIVTLAATGGAAFYFKPDAERLSSSSSVVKKHRPNASTIHRPQPVYPPTQCSRVTQVIHQPQPVYPAGYLAQELSPGGAASSAGMTVRDDSSALLQRVREPDILEDAFEDHMNRALRQFAQHIPWSDQTAGQYLPSFLYDLQEADSRQKLEGVVAIMPADPTPAVKTIASSSVSLLQRLGTFAEGNRRTGRPYTYLLLDDMGGCFRMINHELWLTETAIDWLADDQSYTLTIRRIDDNGRTVDKAFNVKLGSFQMQMAS